jgi:Raf kinase inhibitor-like YbhB/YbcL family protein
MKYPLIAPALVACALVGGAALAEGVTLSVSSPVFSNGSAIPAKYTCDGDGKSPPLAWSNLPTGTQSLAVVVDDPDAPHGTFVHWVVFDVPPGTTALPEGALPAGAEQGKNGKGKLGWTPPCPPSGTHHYRFMVFALQSPLTLSQPTEEDLIRAMSGHILAQGEIVGTYQRGRK